MATKIYIRNTGTSFFGVPLPANRRAAQAALRDRRGRQQQERQLLKDKQSRLYVRIIAFLDVTGITRRRQQEARKKLAKDHTAARTELSRRYHLAKADADRAVKERYATMSAASAIPTLPSSRSGTSRPTTLPTSSASSASLIASTPAGSPTRSWKNSNVSRARRKPARHRAASRMPSGRRPIRRRTAKTRTGDLIAAMSGRN